jgi:hypothetical protein
LYLHLLLEDLQNRSKITPNAAFRQCGVVTGSSFALTGTPCALRQKQTSRPGCFSDSAIQEELYMQQRATATPAVTASNPQSAGSVKCPRSLWVLTAYGISGLALFGVLAYYFSSYIAN